MSEKYELKVSFANYFPTEIEERAFCLGVEWGCISKEIEAGRIDQIFTVRVENIPLLERLATSENLMMEIAETEPMVEGWQLVRFGGAESGGQDKHHWRQASQNEHQTQVPTV